MERKKDCHPREATAALARVKALLSPEALSPMQNCAHRIFPAEEEEVAKFFCELSGKMKSISSVSGGPILSLDKARVKCWKRI